MDNNCKIQYHEKILRAAIIAMDASSPTASGYLLREIPWETLSTDEILKLIKIVRAQQLEASDKDLSLEA